MTFTPNVPVSGQSLGNSRPTINNNFSAIQTTFDANHVDFNSANPGLHTHMDMLAQVSDPNPASGISSHYSKEVAGINEWFFQRESTAGPTDGAVIQMSNVFGIPLASTNGQTFLPGGLILKFITQNVPMGTFGTTITFTNPFPNNVFVAVSSISGNSPSNYNYTISSPSKTQVAVSFQNTITNTFTSLNVMAIGN